MKTTTFGKTVYIIEPGVGYPDDAVDVSSLGSKAQVALYNLIADNLNHKNVAKFKDKATGTKRIIKALVEWDDLPDDSYDGAPEVVEPASTPEPEPEPAPKEKAKRKKRKKRGNRFLFPFNGQDSMRSIRSSDTLRGQCVDLLVEGATLLEVETLVVAFDVQRSKSSKHVARRAYELVRIMHYYVGYGIDHDQGTGIITLHTRTPGQSKT